MSDGAPSSAWCDRMWALLLNELSAELKEAVTPLLPLKDQVALQTDVRALAARCVDLAARVIPARGLELQKHLDAAALVRAVEPVLDAASAKRVMSRLEKIGYQERAPTVLLRAAGGAASTFLLLDAALEKGEAEIPRALMQVVVAVSRVVGLARRMGVNSALMVADFVAASGAVPEERP